MPHRELARTEHFHMIAFGLCNLLVTLMTSDGAFDLFDRIVADNLVPHHRLVQLVDSSNWPRYLTMCDDDAMLMLLFPFVAFELASWFPYFERNSSSWDSLDFGAAHDAHDKPKFHSLDTIYSLVRMPNSLRDDRGSNSSLSIKKKFNYFRGNSQSSSFYSPKYP